MPDWAWYLFLIPAGFFAGVVNTIAGGGSFLTLPALMIFCGLDPQLANGTNRVAILLSSASASTTFYRGGHLDRKLAQQLALPTFLGVPPGVLLAVYLPAKAFEPIFGVIFILMSVVILANPSRLTGKAEKRSLPPEVVFIVFFAIGIYVGFIQAGMGILLLLGMSFVRKGDLVGANGVKNLIGFAVTFIAMLTFAFFNLIDWVPGLIMAFGNLLGGVVGAKLAIQKGNRFILGVLVFIMLATGAKLLLPWFS